MEAENGEGGPRMISASALDLRVSLPEDISLMTPTVYSKLNFINYCQYLLLFQKQREKPGHCEHFSVLEEKVNDIRQIITKIVDTDSVLNAVNNI